MFWQNLIGIIRNLPLIVSDTYDPKDVSLNRVITFGTFLVIIVTPAATVIWYPDMLPELEGYWEKLLMFLGAQTAANIGRRYIDMKGKKMNGIVGNQTDSSNMTERG